MAAPAEAAGDSHDEHSEGQRHDEEGDELRTKAQSWKLLPQHLRGITLRELWHFYNSKKEYLSDRQWRCNSCHRRFPQKHGPCPECGEQEGKMQMPNLYEVNSTMILEYCKEEQISYVEHLSRKRKEGGVGVPVNTFVSHWWGEEFTKFVGSLHRYAHVRAAGKNQMVTKITVTTYVVVSVSLSLVIAAAKVEYLSLLHVFLTFFIAFLAHKASMRWKYCQDPMAWSFWICALANNQFAVGHATGENGILESAFAVALQAPTCNEVATIFDDSATIYRRIWCAFELFFAKVIMPRKFGKSMEVTLTNEYGVLSDGDASLEDIRLMKSAISTVDTSLAEASVEADKHNIHNLMHEEQTSSKDLDAILQQLAEDSVEAARSRQRVPLILFGILPLASVTFSMGLTYSVECGIRSLTQGREFDEDCIVEGPVPLVVSISLIVLMRCILLGLTCRRGVLKERRLLNNALMLLAVSSLPMFLLMSGFAVAEIVEAPTSTRLIFEDAVGKVEAVNAVLRGFLGILTGLFYLVVRNVTAFQAARQRMEDFCVQMGFANLASLQEPRKVESKEAATPAVPSHVSL